MKTFVAKSIFLAVLSSLAFVATPSQGSNELLSQDEQREYRMKCMLIYSMMKYTQWTEAQPYQYVVAVYNNQAVYEIMKTVMAHKSLEGKPIEVVHITDLNQTATAHVVYLTKGHGASAASIRASQCVVVSDEDGIGNGAVMSFQMQGDKPIIGMNKHKLSELDVQISSRFLALTKDF